MEVSTRVRHYGCRAASHKAHSTASAMDRPVRSRGRSPAKRPEDLTLKDSGRELRSTIAQHSSTDGILHRRYQRRLVWATTQRNTRLARPATTCRGLTFPMPELWRPRQYPGDLHRLPLPHSARGGDATFVQCPCDAAQTCYAARLYSFDGRPRLNRPRVRARRPGLPGGVAGLRLVTPADYHGRSLTSAPASARPAEPAMRRHRCATMSVEGVIEADAHGVDGEVAL
jgi:hypothetical protein